MITAEKVNEMRDLLDYAPEVESYDFLEDGSEWSVYFEKGPVQSQHIQNAIRLADSFEILRVPFMLILYFRTEEDGE